MAGRRLGRAVAAGVLGTAAMTAYQELVARLRGGGEEGDGAAPEDPWAAAPAPAKVARLLSQVLLGRDPDPSEIPLLTNVMHWGYGTGVGAAGALVQGVLRPPPAAYGLAFGTTAWAASYAQLVPLGIYEPPWRYDAKTLALDLSYHLVFGLGVGLSYAALSPPRDARRRRPSL